MSKIKGRDVALNLVEESGSVPIAYSRDCDISVNCDVQEFTSALSGRGRRFRAGRYTWNINIEMLVEDSEQPGALLAALKSGRRLEVVMDTSLTVDGVKTSLKGCVVVNSWAEKAPLQGLATCSVGFVGDGELEFYTYPNTIPPVRPPLS